MSVNAVCLAHPWRRLAYRRTLVTMARLKRFWAIGSLALALTWQAGNALAEPWRVVLLAGADPALPSAAQQDNAFRAAIRAAAPDGVEFFTDSVDNLRFQGAELMPELTALMTTKYQRQRVDIVAAWGDLGLAFAERHHEQIWPGKPVLVFSIEDQRLHQRGVPPEFAYLSLDVDIDGTLAIVEALQPQAQRMVVITGASPFDQIQGQRAHAAARARARNWQIDAWNGLPLPELRARLSTLDPNTAVLFTTMF